MTEIFETFSTYLDRIEKVEPSFANKQIILSTEVRIPYLIDGVDESITKMPIAWRLYEHNLFYIVKVPAGKHIPLHTHEEDVFRLILYFRRS